MSTETTHIIKKADVPASRAVRPSPDVLLSSFRIPAQRVELEGEPQVREERRAASRLVHSADADVDPEPVEIFTRHIEDVRPSRSRSDDKPEEVEEQEPTPEEIEAEWKRRLQDEVQRARAEGFEEGRESNRAEMDEAVERIRAAFAADLDAVQHAWEEHLKDARVRLVQIAFRIARVILDAPLPADVRAISETAIRDAVDMMSDGVPVEVALHPVTYLRLQEAGVEDQLTSIRSRLRFRSDPDLKENEWVVQSSRSAIRRLEAELLDQLHRELSLRDVDADVRSQRADGSESLSDRPSRGVDDTDGPSGLPCGEAGDSQENGPED